MIDVPVYNENGDQVETVALDEAAFGGEVRPALLKQAVVMYLANRRQGSATTRSRGMVIGSTRKLYRQKGTGRARMGSIRTVIRRGGGVAFAKRPQKHRKGMPKKMRRLACKNAILAKALSGDFLLLDALEFDEPKTKRFSEMLRALKADRGCVVALPQPDETILKSGRNIPKVDIMPVEHLNAYAVLRRKRLVMTKAAYDVLLHGPAKMEEAVVAGAGADEGSGTEAKE